MTARIEPILLSISISVLFCLTLSISTSPFYTHYGYDSIIFQLIGKYWTQGCIPYVGLWDHKGPYIFFINAFGYLMTGNSIGVLILQITHLAATIYFIFKSISLYYKPTAAWILTLIALAWLGCSFDEGNLTEEYLLPWISAVVYLTTKWTKGKSILKINTQNSAITFLSGSILGLGLMTRLTNATVTCGIMLFLGIVLLANKQWKELTKMIFLFIVGFGFSTLPFVIYFQAKGALQDMWFGTFVMNFSYATGSGGFHIPSIIRNIVLMAAPLVILVPMLFWRLAKGGDSSGHSILWITALVPYLAWLVTSNCFTHYNQVLIPLMPVFFISLHDLFKRTRTRNGVLLATAISGTILLAVSFRHSINNFDYSFCDNAIALVKKEVPAEEMDSFNAWECHPALYMKLGAKPRYPHFIAQAWHASFAAPVREAILKENSSLEAKWLLVAPNRAELIQDILDSHYSTEAQYGTNYTLYRLRNE